MNERDYFSGENIARLELTRRGPEGGIDAIRLLCSLNVFHF